MMHTPNDISSSADVKSTFDTIVNLLNCVAYNPNAEIIYCTSNMILQADSDGAYLLTSKAQNCAGDYHFLGNVACMQSNGPVLILVTIIENMMASAAEAKVAALYLNAQGALVIHQYLLELGYPQPPTPLKTDNVTVRGILTGTIKQKRSKAIGIQFYWF